MMKTLSYGNPETARVMVIGHDPRLQKSDTVAEYAFFADFYFRPIPTTGSEKRKYGLASSVFSCINHLTAGKYRDDELVITNLCNEALPHAPKGKTVYIPEPKAVEGVAHIRQLLAESSIEVIFAMSQQVNYWLHRLRFCLQDSTFLTMASPMESACCGSNPYYSPKKQKAFLKICGRENIADGKYRLYPILHVKQWPLNGKFKSAYGEAYETCRNRFLVAKDHSEPYSR